jgi:hypothetical protein
LLDEKKGLYEEIAESDASVGDVAVYKSIVKGEKGTQLVHSATVSETEVGPKGDSHVTKVVGLNGADLKTTESDPTSQPGAGGIKPTYYRLKNDKRTPEEKNQHIKDLRAHTKSKDRMKHKSLGTSYRARLSISLLDEPNYGQFGCIPHSPPKFFNL